MFNPTSKRLWIGIGIGAGAVMLLPWVLPLITGVARPMARLILRQVLLAAEKTRERAARAAEDLEDLVAEVRADVEETMRREGIIVEIDEAARPSENGEAQPHGASA